MGDVSIGMFDPAVEAWRDLISSFNPPGGVNFHLAWLQKESAGNPCSWTSLRESGAYQLMYPDNLTQAGTTEDQMHPVPPCVSGRQTAASFDSLTDAQAAEQVRAGIQYVNYVAGVARAKLDAAGVTWGDGNPDFWRFVKLQHAYPGPSAGWLASATDQLGHPPASWDELRSTITGYSSVLDNAEWVGGYGGSTALGAGMLAFAAGLGLVWWLARRDRRSRSA